MSTPRPESRIAELESRMSLQDARIRELSADLRQDIKRLREDISQDMHQGFEQAHAYIQEHVATKEDISRIEGDIATLKATQAEHGQLLKEILARLPKSE